MFEPRIIPKTLALLALAVMGQGQAPQTDPAKPTILVEGIVMDRDSGTPIAGARVSAQVVFGVVRQGDPLPTGNLQFVTVDADAKGQFQLRWSGGQNFVVRANAEGYATPARLVPVKLADNQQSAHVEIMLARLSAVKGVLVDEETRKPLAGIRVEAVPWDAGAPIMMGGINSSPTTSLADGSFVLTNISETEFFLHLSADPAMTIKTIAAKDLAGEGRDKALETPEAAAGYGVIYWPGKDARLPPGPGLKVTAGMLDVGEIRLERHTLHNLSGVVNACDAGQSMQLLLAPPMRTDKTVDHDLVCGEGFQILNLPDGAFTLSVVEAGPPRRFAFQPIEATTRGPLTLNLSATLPVEIRVALEGVTPPDLPAELKNVVVELKPESAPVKISTPSKLLSGAMEAELFPGLRYVISPHPPPKYFLKQMSYNGVTSTDVTGFTAYGGILQLTFSDRAGALEATVDSADELNCVMAVRDGMSYTALMGSDLGAFRQYAGGGNKVKLTGLMPGNYRVFVTPTIAPSPDVFEEALRRGTSVTIDEGQTATVALRVP